MLKYKIAYWLFTVLLCAWMLFMAFNFLVNFELTSDFFASIYITPLLIVPLGVLKILAVTAILTDKSRLLKQLAYNGLAVDFCMAIIVHLRAEDGGWPAPLFALGLATISYLLWRKVR